MLSELLVDEGIGAGDVGESFFDVDDEGIVGEGLSDGEGEDCVVVGDDSAGEGEEVEVGEHGAGGGEVEASGEGVGGREGVHVLVEHFDTGYDLDLVLDGSVLPVGELEFEAVDVVAFGLEFFAGEGGEGVSEVKIFIVVVIGGEDETVGEGKFEVIARRGGKAFEEERFVAGLRVADKEIDGREGFLWRADGEHIAGEGV